MDVKLEDGSALINRPGGVWITYHEGTLRSDRCRNDCADSPFDESMMVHFRSRFTQEQLDRINEEIIATEVVKKKEPEPKDDDEPPSHSGKLLVDATYTSADIKYPTDLGCYSMKYVKKQSKLLMSFMLRF